MHGVHKNLTVCKQIRHNIGMGHRDVNPGETTAATADTEAPETTEPAQETVGISLPTEDPADAMPEETFGQENEVPDYTMDPDATAGTEDRESNETPEDVFETGE